MRVAVDAMGGDHAPGEIIRGAVAAAGNDVKIVLVGDQEVLHQELAELRAINLVEVVHAPDVVGMDEAPTIALRKKRDSSISVATRLVQSGEADALVSAGSTGAQMAAALLILGRLPGVQRPAIMTFFPTLKGPCVLLDVGANVDCKPQQLMQFAQMGYIYSLKVMKHSAPRIGLLNIGTEATKGNELTLGTYNLLKNSGLPFAGNIEPRELFQGDIQVVVCDGFVGNTLLKFGEGLGLMLMGLLKQEMTRSLRGRMGGLLVLPGVERVRKLVDYAEYGGAPLLGVGGVSIICHGSSRAPAIKNAVKAARRCVQEGLVPVLAEYIALSGVEDLG